MEIKAESYVRVKCQGNCYGLYAVTKDLNLEFKKQETLNEGKSLLCEMIKEGCMVLLDTEHINTMKHIVIEL